MSSALSFTFRPSLIPAYAQAEFLTRFCQLVLDYETLTMPVPESPSADTLPKPTGFVPVEGDESVPAPAPVSTADKSLDQMTNQELRDILSELTGKPKGRRHTGKFYNKALLIGEIERLRGAATERRVSADSLEAPVAPEQVVAPAPAPADDAASDSSSTKKPRKNPWLTYTPEQKAERIAKLQMGRIAKKVAALSTDGNTSA